MSEWSYARGYFLFFESYITFSDKKLFFFADAEMFKFCFYLMMLFMVISIIPFLTKICLPVAWLLFGVYHLQIDPYLIPYTTNIAFFVLTTFGYFFLKEDFNFSLFKKYILIIMATFYFSAGWSKLMLGGTSWLNGSLLKLYFAENYFYTNNPTLLNVVDQVFFVASVLVVFFEITFFVSVFSEKWKRLYFSLGFLFHGSVYLLFDINFFNFFFATYIVFLPARMTSEAGRLLDALGSLTIKKFSIIKPGRSK